MTTPVKIADAKVGDTVIYGYNNLEYYFRTVKRVVGKYLHLEVYSYNRETGKSTRDGDWNGRVYDPTPELIEKVRRLAAMRDIEMRRVKNRKKTEARIRKEQAEAAALMLATATDASTILAMVGEETLARIWERNQTKGD